MTRDELLTHVKQQLQLSAGYESDAIASDRENALDYYFQRPRGDEVAGRSHVVSGDVSAMVEANLAQMLDAFTSNNIIEFDPLGPEDEDQAQLEADTVTYYVMSKNNGFLQLAQSIKDALLLRNGIVKVWVDEKSQTTTRSFQGVTPEALAEIINQPGVETEVLAYDEDTGDLRTRHIRREYKLKAESLPPENFLYLEDHDSLDLQEIGFCAERHIDSRSTLLELGFPKDVVQRIHPYASNYKADAAARNPQKHTLDTRGVDESQDPIEWYECYVLIDADGDGISERHKVCISGDELLSDELVRLVPYAAGTAILNPHRFLGISLYDKLRQVQDLNTGLTRALMDNVNTTTKNRTAYLDGKVNVDDLNSGRSNGDIRVKAAVADVRQAIMPFNIPDLTQGILMNIQDQRQVRTELGGAALELASGQMQLNDRVGSQGLDRAYSVMEQLASMMTKTIASSLIRSTFLLAHATLREYFQEPVPVKRNGKWFSPVPSEWQERECITVKVGMSPGERARRANTLHTMLVDQITLADKGMDDVLVNINGFYKLLMDWGRTSDVQNPEQYFVDPESDAAKEAMVNKRQQAELIQQQQTQLMQQAVQLEQLRTAFDKYKQDTDLQFNYYDANLKAEIEEAKIVGKATTELVKQEGPRGDTGFTQSTGAGKQPESDD